MSHVGERKPSILDCLADARVLTELMDLHTEVV